MERPHLRERRRARHVFPRKRDHVVASSPPEKSTCLKNKRLWLKRIELLSSLREHSVEELAESFGLSSTEFLKEFERKEGPSLKTLTRLADHFEISLDDLADGKIDSEWIRSPQLDEMFLAHKGSRLRTSLAVLDWIHKHHGPNPATSLVRSLRIPQSALTDPDRPVRLHLLCKLLRKAEKRGIGDADFFAMGLNAVQIPQNRLIREALSQQKTPKEVYEYFFSEIIDRFESNFDYKIHRIRSNELTLHIEAREECVFENGTPVTTDRNVSIYRWGVTAGLLQSIDLPNAVATPVRFATPDSPIEVVELSWDSSHHAAITPLSSRRRSISL